MKRKTDRQSDRQTDTRESVSQSDIPSDSRTNIRARIPEGDGIYDGGLADFPAGEDAPGDGDGFDGVGVGLVDAAVVVDDVVVDPGVLGQRLDQAPLVLPRDEKLQIRLLEDESVLVAPAEDLRKRRESIGQLGF